MANNATIKFASMEQQENLLNTRKTFKVLQQAATDKENLAGRPTSKICATKESSNKVHIDFIDKNDLKRKKIATTSKGVQADAASSITADDLTSDAPSSEHYWQVIAERRREALDKTLEENELLHGQIADLVEENKSIKDMLDESRSLIEVLTEMLNESSNPVNASVAEEAIEDAVQES
ncbi:geminin-like [Ctenocephalides felis]|uniref:geminin-like n=1 Tax=Ctenocephalides felis TaxID=7515 RepID=UPI000E6E1DEA|nr:geminin-like [Ctenocephalides felis]